MKIAVKTKINEWAAAGEKEKIVFDLLDFSPDQVAELDRCIRNNGEDKLRMVIEVTNRQLQFAPIESQVRLVSMNCMSGGQKLKIAEFSSPDDKAKTLKRLIASGEQVTLTITELQGRMFDEAEDPEHEEHEKSEESSGPPKDIKLKFPKSYGTECMITIEGEKGTYQAGYTIKIGHAVDSEISKDCPHYSEISSCLRNVKNLIFSFIDAQANYKYSKQAKKKIEKAIEDWLFQNT